MLASRYLPVPLSGIIWGAFAALSEIVTAEGTKPRTAGINCTVSKQLCFGNNCSWQFVAPFPNPNTCGVVTGTENGLVKVIGGPSWAELLSLNVTDLAFPTVTLPKLPDGGLISKLPGTGVGVEVGVGVTSGPFVPIPLSDMCCGAFEALSLIVRVSTCSPFAAGLKRMPTLHLTPTPTLVPHVLLTT